MDRPEQRAPKGRGRQAERVTAKDPASASPLRLAAVRIEFPDAVTFKTFGTLMQAGGRPRPGRYALCQMAPLARYACPASPAEFSPAELLPFRQSKLEAINTHW